MFETVEFTNMCMICDGSRVVVIDRKKRDWPGITFPGGHIEPGESFTDAVIREVQEETGLHIRSPQLVAPAPVKMHLVSIIRSNAKGDGRPPPPFVRLFSFRRAYTP